MARSSLLSLGLVIAVYPAWLLVTGWDGARGEQLKPGKLPKEIQIALKPGLTLRFYADAAAKNPLDTRRIRLAALHVPAGSPPSPLLAPRSFTARLSGYVKTPLRGEYTFALVGTGTAALTLNGKEVLSLAEGKNPQASSAVDLPKGYSRIELIYTSPAKGDAAVRVYWSGETFAKEPLPPEVVFTRGDEADLVEGTKWREGRLLYATLGCARCHALPGKRTAAECAMPELQQRAPSLEGAARRLRAEWVARWIAEPRSLRPQATMPQVLHGANAGQQAADITAYLVTLDGAKPPAHPAQGTVEQGEKLFEQLGCITCHHVNDPKQEDTHGRLSLFFAAAKFRPDALAAYLRAPHEHHPWSRMPDFKLTPKEAGALTAFLLDRTKGAVPAPGHKGDAQLGAKLFREAGCAACHAVKPGEPPAAPRLPAPAAAALGKGCLAEAAKRGKAPDFGLSEQQRQALRAFLQTDGSSLTRETPAEFSLRQVEVLQCTACHRRDGANSRLAVVVQEEGSGQLPEGLPSLTWAGEKLRPEWTVKLLLGQHDHRARPWLKARMPAFPARADLLAVGLSHEHGFGVAEDPRPASDAELAEVGRKLLPMQGGFNCVLCHGVGKEPAAAFEAPGINLLDAALRLRHEYYQRWMLDPPRVDITTRMPKFAPDGKATPLTDVLGGDAHRQFEAIWHHLQTLPEKASK